LLAGGRKQFERAAVDVDDSNFAHAALNEFRVYVGKDAKIDNAALARLLDQLLDPVEILDP
jgi:hypothetical protein